MKLLGSSGGKKNYGSTTNENLSPAARLLPGGKSRYLDPNPVPDAVVTSCPSPQKRLSSEVPSDADDVDRNAPWGWPRRIKVTLLTLLVAAMTVMLLFLPEEAYNERVVTVTEKDPVVYDLDRAYRQQGRDSEKIMRVRIDGSFMPEEATNLAREFVYVIAHKDSTSPNETHTEQRWTLGVLPEELADYFYSEQRSQAHVFDLQGIDLERENVSLVLSTDASYPVALDVRLEFVSSLAETWGVVLGAIILVAMYVGVASEAIPRTVVTMLAATACVSVLALLDERPTLDDILGWIDVETLTLLFSMMLIVSVLGETGAFDFVGYYALVAARGRPWPMVGLLCLLTALISAFLDNVTTILLITPVVIRLCEALHIDPRRVLIACVIFSNIGGAATPIGDPPNVLIASDPGMQAGGVTFAAFTAHAGVCVLLVAIIAALQLRLMYGASLGPKNDAAAGQTEDELGDLRHEIAIWRRTAHSMGNISREEVIVRQAVEDKVHQLEQELQNKEQELINRQESLVVPSVRFHSPSSNDTNDLSSLLLELRRRCQVRDRRLLVTCCVVLSVAVVLFFLSNFPSLNLSLGWTALLAAMATLVLADKHDVESVLSRVEWATLVFFATLFVVMEALERMGLLRYIGNLVESWVESVPPDYRLAASIVLIVWVSGIASAVIDNIPFTTMMIPIVLGLAENPDLQLPLGPLAWSLSLGACLGGNGTLIGASANVVCAGVAEQHGYKISFWRFFQVGFPVTLVSLVVATAYLLVCHVVLDWN